MTMKSVDVLDEAFSQQCNVRDDDSADRYGYGNAAPDHDVGAETTNSSAASADKYGYGEAAPDSAEPSEKYGHGNDDHDYASYGYGDAAPDSGDKYGYGDATPDYASYGYGDSAPDASADKYGYGNATPDYASYGYGDTAPDSSEQYGYGDAAPDDAAKYGYGDDDADQKQSPNRTFSSDSVSASGGRRERPRRRGSVTKYSLETAEAVKEEYETNNDILNQYRNGSEDISEEVQVCLKDEDGNRDFNRNRTMSDDSFDDMSCDNVTEKKKKKRFARLRIGRNRSGMSTESNHSSSSKN